MYFSISNVKHDRGAQLAVMTASQLGERMLAGENAHIAFEAAVADLSKKTGHGVAEVALQLMNADADYRKKAIRVGAQQIIKTFGGEDTAMAFFRQINAPTATIRFESVGGVKDDILLAKNRSAVLAIKAAGERWRNKNHVGYTPSEREFVEFSKSVRRTLDKAVENGQVDAVVAQTISTQIEEAAYTDQRPHLKDHITVLQAEASQEVFAEARSQLLRQYAQAANPSPKKPDGPSMH
jgi:hypothetical protein